jgi:hypothetical protein
MNTAAALLLLPYLLHKHTHNRTTDMANPQLYSSLTIPTNNSILNQYHQMHYGHRLDYIFRGSSLCHLYGSKATQLYLSAMER